MANDHFVHFENARLLVVDDDPILREFATSNLATPKVEVEVAADGDEAWHKLHRGNFDIALVDLDMPVMDGFELIGLIRSNEALKHLPIVIATGREDMDAVDRAYAAGATSFVVKPLNWRLISHQLSYVLRASREEAIVRETLHGLRRRVRVQDEIMSLSMNRLDRLVSRIGAETERLSMAFADGAPTPSPDRMSAASCDLQKLRDDIGAAVKLA